MIEVSATTSSKKQREVNQDEGKQEKKQWLLEELSKQDELKKSTLSFLSNLSESRDEILFKGG
jgi:hypothetical protein